jgi:myo-inositol-1(or 4)-monophosphatase
VSTAQAPGGFPEALLSYAPVTEDERLLDLAREAALRGAEVILRSGHGARPSEEKGAGDYVTDVDRRSEQTIARHLTSGAPGIPMVGEEAGGAPSDRYWLVDPLDGTTNFLHGLPMVGVSVALVADGRPLLGVVHAPFLRTTWSASRGRGADRDGRPIRGRRGRHRGPWSEPGSRSAGRTCSPGTHAS